MTNPAQPNGDGSKPTLSVGQLARLTSTSTSAINYYVRAGLLPAPQKTSRTRALYGNVHVERIGRIKELQERGLSLRLIRNVLESNDPASELGIATDRSRQRPPSAGPVTIDELLAESGLRSDDYRRLVAARLLRPARGSTEGAETHDRRDILAARAFARLLELGVSHRLLARHAEYEPLARAEAHFLAEHVTSANDSDDPSTAAIASAFDAVRRYLRLLQFESEFPHLSK